jgi:hypothetical protein
MLSPKAFDGFGLPPNRTYRQTMSGTTDKLQRQWGWIDTLLTYR